MRCWVGKEVEGYDTGVRTLFVESKTLTMQDADVILFLLRKYDVSRCYLGAGKVDIETASVQFCEKMRGIELVIETSAANVEQVLCLFPTAQIVMRIDVQPQWKQRNLVPKLDFNGVVRVFGTFVENDSSSVVGGCYKDDLIVWQEIG